jgi:NAD(P)-dependent dehydrogenase (short-subunit alcohol dehydrogenase family)
MRLLFCPLSTIASFFVYSITIPQLAMAPLVWLITGTTSGIGEQFVHALLARGDKVIAASRNISKLAFQHSDSLKRLQIDVTAPQSEINLKAEEALKFFGTVDVVVNNSAFYRVGVVEELELDFPVRIRPSMQ